MSNTVHTHGNSKKQRVQIYHLDNRPCFPHRPAMCFEWAVKNVNAVNGYESDTIHANWWTCELPVLSSYKHMPCCKSQAFPSSTRKVNKCQTLMHSSPPAVKQKVLWPTVAKATQYNGALCPFSVISHVPVWRFHILAVLSLQFVSGFGGKLYRAADARILGSWGFTVKFSTCPVWPSSCLHSSWIVLMVNFGLLPVNLPQVQIHQVYTIVRDECDMSYKMIKSNSNRITNIKLTFCLTNTQRLRTQLYW